MKKRPLIPYPGTLHPDVVLVPLANRKGFATIDRKHAEEVGKHNWSRGGGYVHAYDAEHRTAIYLHRLIAQEEGWETPQVDHIDGDRLNNCVENLRPATNAQNGRNRGPTLRNHSGFKGVSWDRKAERWQVHIRRDGKTIFLGNFDSAEEGARAYDDAASDLHAEYARLNFPRTALANDAKSVAQRRA